MESDFKVFIKNKNFWYLWISQILSQLTIQLMNFLIIVKLFESTGSSIVSSFIWIAYAIPAIIAGPIGAAWVDMADKKSTLMITNFLQAMTILFYALVGDYYLFLSYMVVMVYSFFNQFYIPAEAASLPSVVRREDLARANGLFFLTQQASILVGFGAASVLRETVGFEFAFIIAAVSLFIAFISVSFLPQMSTRKQTFKHFEDEVGKFFERIAEGYHFIKDNKRILLPFVLMVGLHVAVSVTAVSLPVIATEILKIRASSSGYIVVIPAGIGAILSTIFIPEIIKKVRKRDFIEKSLLVVSFIVWGIAFGVPYFHPSIKVGVAMMLFALVGFAAAGIFVVSQTYLQEKTPSELMGRVFGNFWFVATIATIIPVPLLATVSDLLGVRAPFFILGLGGFAAYILALTKGRRLLAMDGGKNG